MSKKIKWHSYITTVHTEHVMTRPYIVNHLDMTHDAPCECEVVRVGRTDRPPECLKSFSLFRIILQTQVTLRIANIHFNPIILEEIFQVSIPSNGNYATIWHLVNLLPKGY
jgi:hypothetical protein